jgi:outer membrane receptor protein involved in Fe transport
MNRKLAAAIGSVLACSAYSTVATAQQQPPAGSPEAPTELEMVTVTGSLIPQIQRETASPVVAITAEDMERQGFQNINEVLRAQPLATGAVQDNQFSGGFTPGATTISLLGLEPGFTLILLDGRPMADYPLLYNGQANFTDLSNIPTAMIERIDVLPGNQSAIYGSAAVAGVVNIILKKHLEGVDIAARVGGYEEGGGDNARFELTGGMSRENFDVTYGLQYSSQKAIWGTQRKKFDSHADDPNPDLHFGSRTILSFYFDLNTGLPTYQTPSQANCDAVADNFGGTTRRDFRPGRGTFCGSLTEAGYGTFLNEQEGTSAYVNANWNLGENAELYAVALLSDNRVESNSGSRFWVPDVNGVGSNYIFDDTRTQPFRSFQHIFSPEETGGRNKNNEHNNSQSYNVALGVHGAFGDSTWEYDTYYARSQYEVDNRQNWALTSEVEDFFRDQFLGPQLGTYYGYPIYHPDYDAFYTSVTPEQYDSFISKIKTDSETWTHSLNFRLTNTDLFQMPAGPVGFAALAQVGKQSWDNPTDPRVIAGDFWGLTGTQGAGERENWATAFEFRVPLFSMLTANLSARYDDYKNVDAGSDSRTTYKAGLEFRPVDSWLFRASYATAFRAPDMAYVFAGASGFFTTVIDYFRCEELGQPLDTCTFANSNIQGSRSGNPDLKSITADSFGFGVVWSPTNDIQARLDYYDIKIDNEVSDLDIDRILREENECRQGRLDINSPTCVQALSHVDRGAATDPVPNQLNSVSINPINISKESVSGIVAGLTYQFPESRAGNFQVNVDYNRTLDHEYTQFPGDQPIDLLNEGFYSTEFASVVTADFIWGIGKFTTTVHGTRYGSTPNFAEQQGAGPVNGVEPGDIDPYLLFNLNVNYQLTDNSSVALTLNNALDEGPPEDKSFSGVTAYPYYNIFNFNGYGRAWWVEYQIQLGGGAK